MAYTLGVVLFLKQKRGQNLDVSFEFQIPTPIQFCLSQSAFFA